MTATTATPAPGGADGARRRARGRRLVGLAAPARPAGRRLPGEHRRRHPLDRASARSGAALLDSGLAQRGSGDRPAAPGAADGARPAGRPGARHRRGAHAGPHPQPARRSRAARRDGRRRARRRRRHRPARRRHARPATSGSPSSAPWPARSWSTRSARPAAAAPPRSPSRWPARPCPPCSTRSSAPSWSATSRRWTRFRFWVGRLPGRPRRATSPGRWPRSSSLGLRARAGQLPRAQPARPRRGRRPRARPAHLARPRGRAGRDHAALRRGHGRLRPDRLRRPGRAARRPRGHRPRPPLADPLLRPGRRRPAADRRRPRPGRRPSRGAAGRHRARPDRRPVLHRARAPPPDGDACDASSGSARCRAGCAGGTWSCRSPRPPSSCCCRR